MPCKKGKTMSDQKTEAKSTTAHVPLDSLVRCPICQRGDIWQEAANRAQYVYKDDQIGLDAIDYLLAEVGVMLEQANKRISG